MKTTDAHFLEHPEVKELFSNILLEITNESDRGSVIIGADVLDSTLKVALQKIMESNKVSKSAQKDLFVYSGAMGCLSSKIDVLYAFGVITKKSRDSAHALRKIRNNAAHTNASFKLTDNHDSLRKMYNLGDNVPEVLNVVVRDELKKTAVDALLEYKKDGERYFKTPEDVIGYLSENPTVTSGLEKHLPQREFGWGLVLLCAVIIHQRDKYLNTEPGDGIDE